MPRIVHNVILILLLLAGQAPGQSFQLRNFSTPEGLPSSETYRVFQDSHDFIWLLTDRGVARFDGQDFQIFSSKDGLPPVLTFHINEDKEGNVWLLNEENQFYRFDGERFEFYPIGPDRHGRKLQPFFQDKRWGAFAFDSTGAICFGRIPGGEVRVTTEQEVQFQTTEVEVSFDCRVVNGQLLAGANPLQSPQEVSQRAEKGDLKIRFRLPVLDTIIRPGPDQVSLANPWLAGDGRRWLAFGKGNQVHVYGQNGRHFTYHTEAKVLSLMIDRQDQLWIGTRQGALVIPLAEGNIPRKEHILPDAEISDILQDREGGYWFTTLGSGVYYARSPEVEVLPGLAPGDQITSLAGNDEAILVGTYQGSIIVYESDRTYPLRPVTSTPWVQDAIQPMLWHPPSQTFYAQAPDGLLLIRKQGTDWQIVQTLDSKPRYTALATAQDKGVWAGGGELSKLGTEESIPLKGQRVRALYESRKGQLFWGNFRGLYSREPEGQRFWGSEYPELNVRVNQISELTDGTLLLATHGRGLVLLKSDGVSTIDQEAELPGEIVHRLFPESDSIVWLAGNLGLSRVNLSIQPCSIRHYSTHNGLTSNEVVDVVVRRDTVWAATKTGLNRFGYQDLGRNRIAHHIFLAGLKVNSRDTSANELLHLEHGQNNLSLEYRAVSFRQMGALNYRIRLSGQGEEWTETSEQTVQYVNLAPGEYRFEVQSQMENGEWTRAKTLLELNIAKPWWETWIFRIAALLVVVLLVLGIIQLRTRVRDRENRLKIRMAELEKQALQAQMNPHFLFNSLNAVQSYISDQETFKAEQYLADFARLIRLMLENSRSPFIPFSHELELLRKYLAFEAIRFEGKISFDLQNDPGINASELLVPPMLIQPYLENAIVHGLARKQGGGMVEVRFVLKKDHLFATVTDNGIGREEARKTRSGNRTSSGMLITQERLEILNRDIAANHAVQVIDLKDDTGKATGTRVEVVIPIRKKEH